MLVLVIMLILVLMLAIVLVLAIVLILMLMLVSTAMFHNHFNALSRSISQIVKPILKLIRRMLGEERKRTIMSHTQREERYPRELIKLEDVASVCSTSH
mmetsp:Transcript_50841/g.110297  ORF Transcript_50841/g.110297 Transcript_50841/m.110297 type:complete len:99 (+) Transcript_50841:91-387(+)